METIRVGQLWVCTDPRDTERGYRQLKVEGVYPQVGPGGCARVRNTTTGRVSFISLRRFKPSSRGYRRVDCTCNGAPNFQPCDGPTCDFTFQDCCGTTASCCRGESVCSPKPRRVPCSTVHGSSLICNPEGHPAKLARGVKD